MKKARKNGFTVVELTIAITTIGILAAVLIPTFGGIIRRAEQNRAVTEARNAYTRYLLDHDPESGDIYVKVGTYDIRIFGGRAEIAAVGAADHSVWTYHDGVLHRKSEPEPSNSTDSASEEPPSSSSEPQNPAPDVPTQPLGEEQLKINEMLEKGKKFVDNAGNFQTELEGDVHLTIADFGKLFYAPNGETTPVVKGTGDLDLGGHTLTIRLDSAAYGVYVDGSLTIRNGKLRFENSSKFAPIYLKDKNSTVTLKDIEIVTDADVLITSGVTAWLSGEYYDPQKNVTLEHAHLTSGKGWYMHYGIEKLLDPAMHITYNGCRVHLKEDGNKWVFECENGYYARLSYPKRKNAYCNENTTDRVLYEENDILNIRSFLWTRDGKSYISGMIYLDGIPETENWSPSHCTDSDISK